MKKLKWGLIGGGEGSQIGGTHRIAAGLDGQFELAAAALDIDPARGRDFAVRLGLPEDRAYGDWREMLAGEIRPADRIDLVTVATPNSTHHEITKAFLTAGFDVLCEKPLTTSVGDAEDIVATARNAGRICAVNLVTRATPWCVMPAPWLRGAISAGSGWWWRSSPTAITPMPPMPTILASAGATTRSSPASPQSLPTPAFTPCTWPASSPA